jgi:hypothetical protein
VQEAVGEATLADAGDNNGASDANELRVGNAG